ncbi:penicillin-binding protein 2, partial [bacterium]|nr:penicillin-binding protein 2 [bacterium]
MNGKDKIDRKLKWLRLAFLFAFLTIGARLYYVQIVKHEFWLQKANKQHFIKKKVLRRRGTIFDRNGNQLAFTASVKKMTCDPTKVKDPHATISVLSRFTRLEIKPLLKKLIAAKKKKRRYLLLKRDVSSQEYLKIRSKMRLERKSLPSPNDFGVLANCIYFEDSYKRYYPYNMIASNVLGFVGRDGRGLEGVELFYEDILKSEDGIRSYERGLNGLIIPNSEKRVRKASGGTSIYLTLDVVIQYIVEKKLLEAFEVNRPKSAVVVVMNPHNGEILAMASQPNYNPNYYPFYSAEDFKNRVISDQVEPGSTMKVFTVAAALEANAITTIDEFSCNGYIELYDIFRIHCDGRRSHGDLDCSHILKKSCNVGAIQIAQRLGTRRLYDYMRLFGFGEKTGIQLPGEIKGLNRVPSTWSGISLAAKSIGQEVAVNSLQVARAFSSIVNGGLLYRPQIIVKTQTVEGKYSEIAQNPIRR